MEDSAGKVKIKVGVGSQSKMGATSIRKPESSKKAPVGDGLDQNPSLASIPLHEFCSRSYIRKRRREKNNVDGLKVNKSTQNEAESYAKQRKVLMSKNSSSRPLQPVTQPSESVEDIGPRVEIVDGKIVIKESSLMVGTIDSNAAENEYEEIEEGIHASSYYSSFTNRRKSATWGIEETKQFYKVLQQCGTEFSVMQTFFPNRTRKELKTKFFREEERHPELIKKSLNSSEPLELFPFEIKYNEVLSNANESFVLPEVINNSQPAEAE